MIGYGSDFMLSTNGGSTYNTVGTVLDIPLPDIKTKDVQTTGVQATVPWHSFVPGLGDGGQAKFKLLFDKVSFNTILANFRVSNYFKIVFPDKITTASILVVTGYVNSIGGQIPLEDNVVADIGIKVSGQPVFTQGT